jgi:hypothetical protein
MANDASGPSQADLKLQPYMIPKLQQAFQSALDQLSELTKQGSQDFAMAKPAMADGASVDFRTELNKVAQEAGQQLTSYQQRLADVVRKLGDIQKAYQQNEHDTAIKLSSQLET